MTSWVELEQHTDSGAIHCKESYSQQLAAELQQKSEKRQNILFLFSQASPGTYRGTKRKDTVFYEPLALNTCTQIYQASLKLLIIFSNKQICRRAIRREEFAGMQDRNTQGEKKRAF